MKDKTHFIKSVSKKLFKTDSSKRPKPTAKELKTRESEIGARIFGPLKPNERREFFNDNERSWFFHQELTDQTGKVHSVTLHYEVHPKGVLRISSQPHVKNEFISGQELENFLSATDIYYERVMNQVYNRDHITGKKLQ